MTRIEAQRSKQAGAQQQWERGREKRRVFIRQLPQPPSLLEHAPGQQPDQFGFHLLLTPEESNHRHYLREQPEGEKMQRIWTTPRGEDQLLDN